MMMMMLVVGVAMMQIKKTSIFCCLQGARAHRAQNDSCCVAAVPRRASEVFAEMDATLVRQGLAVGYGDEWAR